MFGIDEDEEEEPFILLCALVGGLLWLSKLEAFYARR
jgi:hypothetical protein